MARDIVSGVFSCLWFIADGEQSLLSRSLLWPWDFFLSVSSKSMPKSKDMETSSSCFVQGSQTNP